MDKQKKQIGGAGRGQGRKPLFPGAPLVRAEIKLSAPQKEKLKRLGGAPWVRNKIDQEPEPE